ncbi:MAG: EipA family protein [Pseudomonadota bacterium]
MALSSFWRNGAVGLMAVATLAACATPRNNPTASTDLRAAQDQAQTEAETYNESELVAAISTHLGVTSESAATAIERLFKERGQPVGYITGEEGGGALTIGARFGKGTLWMKDGSKRELYWQGPTIGFDAGGDASKVFTLVYGLNDLDQIYRRFPGVDGSAYLVAGMAVNYQRTDGITLAPIRTGVGVRLGANIGYTRYTRERALPF